MGQSSQEKKIEFGQSPPDDRANRKKYQELLEKAEKLFQKEKFGSARHHFTEAQQIYPSEELQNRIHACEENAGRMALAQDLMRQGYQLEREKKLKDAFKTFQRSLEAWENREIRILAEKLQSKLPKPTLDPGFRLEAERRYAEAIERYKEVLEWEDNPQAKDRMGICLVKQGSYTEAAWLLEQSLSKDPEIRYYAGYALARLGHYGEALRQWEMIGQARPELNRQREKLLEIAVRDLLHRSRLEGEFESAYQEAVNLLSCYPALSLVRQCVRSMRLHHLEELWQQGKFEAILDFLSVRHPIPLQESGESEEFLPVILAKVYYRLAETNAEYLPEAITFWLTVIHNPKYLAPFNLRDQKDLPTAEGQDQLTLNLQQKLDQLIQHYKTRQKETGQKKSGQGEISLGKTRQGETRQRETRQEEEGRLKEILAHWEIEQMAVTFLREITQAQDPKPAQLRHALCTPAFAERFGHSSSILAILREVRPRWENDERFWIVGASFSAARMSLLLLQKDRVEEAMAALPAQKEDEFVNYCRQRIFFRLGMERLQKGETNLKKYFTQAVPLIQRFKEYEKEIIRLAQGIGDNQEKLISMDEVLQVLIRHITSSELLEITSYIMSYKANVLYSAGLIKVQDVERILKKALELHPGNEFARSGLQEMHSRQALEELTRALDKGNVKKAATITINAESDEAEEAFFDFIDVVLEELDSPLLDREKKILFLRDLYHQCERVDPSHPVLEDIAEELKDLEI
ncbi:MAG: tetratricopeptide repeat protein [bacterium]